MVKSPTSEELSGAEVDLPKQFAAISPIIEVRFTDFHLVLPTAESVAILRPHNCTSDAYLVTCDS